MALAADAAAWGGQPIDQATAMPYPLGGRFSPA